MPGQWPLRRAKICQPKTDVSPGLAGGITPAAADGSCELTMNWMARCAGCFSRGSCESP